MNRHTSEQGFALAAALISITILAAVAMAGFLTIRQESRIGQASEKSAMAFYMAEDGLNQVMERWDAQTYNNLTIGASNTVTQTLPHGTVDVTVIRGADMIFYLDAVSNLTSRGAIYPASRRIGVVARLSTAEIEPKAALTTRHNAEVRGTAEVHGEDRDPLAWSNQGLCSGDLEDKPGILIDDTSGVSSKGKGEITGAPALVEDTTLSDSTFTQFGQFSWEDLVALADVRLPSGTINGTAPTVDLNGACDTSNPLNWGEPWSNVSACQSYFPIIHVDGTVTIQSAGRGQGLLLVEGDLDLRGGFEFYGVVIVKGNFETQGNGNKVFGAAMASNADFQDQTLVGGSVTQWSSCAVERMKQNLSSLSRVRPLEERSWVDLSSLIGD